MLHGRNRSSSLGSIYVWTIVGGVAQGPDVRKIPQGQSVAHSLPPCFAHTGPGMPPRRLSICLGLRRLPASHLSGHSCVLLFADGLSGVALSCGRPMLVGVSHGGTVFMLRETFTTTFPVSESGANSTIEPNVAQCVARACSPSRMSVCLTD